MNITNEQIRQQQFTPGKGDTQKIYFSSASRNGGSPVGSVSSTSTGNAGSPVRGSQCGGSFSQKSPTAEKPLDVPIQPPGDPAKRLEFWLDTCRGFAHIKFACVQIQELYRKHGCRFAEPTHEQVSGVLTALDGAMPQWEKEHPELFYQTLELSFPELLIRR